MRMGMMGMDDGDSLNMEAAPRMMMANSLSFEESGEPQMGSAKSSVATMAVSTSGGGSSTFHIERPSTILPNNQEHRVTGQ
jgi:hypothetical protein